MNNNTRYKISYPGISYHLRQRMGTGTEEVSSAVFNKMFTVIRKLLTIGNTGNRMSKHILAGFSTAMLMTATADIGNADILVDQQSTWDYTVLTTDLWPDWGTAGYNSFNWQFDSWLSGKAAFGNPYWGGLPYTTFWEANTDLALQKTFNIAGILSAPITLNVASDNGFIIFINGQQVAKENAEKYTFYWEYTIPLTTLGVISPGLNYIQVLAEDHGLATFFDLQLSGNVSPVPEPATMLLFGTGLAGLAGMVRRKKKG